MTPFSVSLRRGRRWLWKQMRSAASSRGWPCASCALRSRALLLPSVPPAWPAVLSHGPAPEQGIARAALLLPLRRESSGSAARSSGQRLPWSGPARRILRRSHSRRGIQSRWGGDLHRKGRRWQWNCPSLHSAAKGGWAKMGRRKSCSSHSRWRRSTCEE